MTDPTPDPPEPVAEAIAPTPETVPAHATAPAPDVLPAADISAAVVDTAPQDGAASPPTVPPVAEASPGAPPESSSPASVSGSGRRRPAVVLGYLAVGVLGAILGAGALALAGGGFTAAAPTPSPPAQATPSAVPGDNGVGRLDAPVTIEVWADYQCPYCRLEASLFGGVLDREYVVPGVARVVYRDFTFLGQESIDAAVAARCAGAQEPAARLRYHDTLYTFQQGENQGRFARANLLQMASIAGVPDQAAFTACLDSPAMAAAVAAETAVGRGLGVSSTPTIRLSGPGGERLLDGFSQAWPTLRDAIEAVRLAPVGSPSPASSPSSSPAASAPASPPASAAPSRSPAPSP